MINKKLIFFAIFFISLLAISGVSASEIDSDIAINDDDLAIDAEEVDNSNLESADLQLDDNSDNKERNDNENEGNFKSSSNSELLTEYTYNVTFSTLAHQIESAGDELNLTMHYYYNSSTDSSYKNGIIINKSITINGNGHTITGYTVRAFNITNNNVILRNINFINFNRSNQGAIYWDGVNGSVSNCTFINCKATNGGAIYWDGVNGSVSNCSFINCTSSFSASYSSSYGYSSNYSSISSASCGGAIYWDGVNGAISNCSFINTICSSSSSITSDSYCISESFSASYGGAIYWNSTGGSVSDCSFINCSSKTESISGSSGDAAHSHSHSFSSSFGGAIYWNSAESAIQNCSFINCSSYANSSSIYNCSRVPKNISASSYSYSYGGAVYCDGNDSYVLNCSFTNCIYMYDYKSSTGYSSNPSNTYAGGLGGSVYCNGDYDSVSNCSFIDCGTSYSYDYGCAVYCNGDFGSVSNCSFVNCNSSYGGAVYCNGDFGSVSNCSFLDCDGNNGGAVYWNGTYGSVSNCSFLDCDVRSGSYGGAVYWNGDFGSVSNCSFIRCSASSGYNYGGAVYWKGIAGSVFNCSFVNCSANYGSAIFWSGKNGTLYNCIYNDLTNYSSFVSILDNSKLDAPLNISVHNILFNESENVEIEYLGYSREIKVYVYDSTNHRIYNVSNNSQLIEFSLDNLPKGIYNVTVFCSEDGIFKTKNESAIFEVLGHNPSININHTEKIIAGDNLTVNISLNDDAEGNISILINNNTYCGEVIGGKTTIILSNIIGGELEYILNYSGDHYYNSTILNGVMNVEFKPSFINFQVDDTDFSQIITLNPIAPIDSTGIVSIFINEEFIDNFSIGQTYNLVDLNVGDYNLTLKYSGDNYYSSCENTSTFKINKIDPKLIVDIPNLKAGDVEVYIDFETEAYGNVSLIIDNKSYTNEFTNNTIIIIPNLKAGVYNYEISYSGDQNHNPLIETHTMAIELRESKIDLEISNVTEGESLNLRFNITGNDLAIISLYLNNTFLMNVSASENVSIPNLKHGKYNITAIYNANEYYDYSIDTKEFTVFAKSVIKLDLNDINYKESIILCPLLTTNATGTIKIYVDDIFENEISVGGTYYLLGLCIGNHTVRVVYSGDDYFTPCENSTSFKVNKLTPTIELQVNDLTAGDNANIVFQLNNDTTGNIIVNGSVLDIINGRTILNIPNIKGGIHIYNLRYTGDSIYYDYTADYIINVAFKETIIDFILNDIYLGENLTFTPIITDISVGLLDIYVDDMFNGSINIGSSITIPFFERGSHSIKVSFGGDNYYSANTTTKTFNVNIHTILSEDTKVTYNSNYFRATFLDKNGDLLGNQEIQFKIGDKEYNMTTNSNGVATLDVILNSGTYNITSINLVTGETKVNEFVVNKLSTSISSPAINAVYNAGNYLVVTLKDSNGKILVNKKVTVTVGTISKTLTTNVNGQLSILISNLIPKTYTATIKFAGDNNYIGYTKKITVVVKKATPKLTAKAKTFRRSVKTKKYSITLKNNKGKVMKNTKVTLRVNKKTYSVRTNSKGVATFKITNLKKKGKFRAVVKYAGSKYYNKVTKKPIITIKA